MFLSPEIILEGYNKGLFPMADSFNDPFIYWVEPKERGIIKLNEFKISRSLKKELKKSHFKIRVNQNFEKTINLEFCACSTIISATDFPSLLEIFGYDSTDEDPYIPSFLSSSSETSPTEIDLTSCCKISDMFLAYETAS